MKPKLILGLFVALVAVQLAVPIGQIWKHEDILRTGTPYKFRTAPVDPYDAFRGRYVALNYADTTARVNPEVHLKYRQAAYVTLATNDLGFAEFGELTAAPPIQGDYLRVAYIGPTYTNRELASFQLPFDRFYMQETQAPKAEEAYRLAHRAGSAKEHAYVLVRVKEGRGVIEDLFVAAQPICEYLRRR